MYYFRFEIPLQDDDKTVAYSPGWHGELARCPQNVTVLLYNDAEGYGIAMADDTFIPPEVEVITEQDWLDELSGLEEKVTTLASVRATPVKQIINDKQIDVISEVPKTMDGLDKGIWWGTDILAARWDAVKELSPDIIKEEEVIQSEAIIEDSKINSGEIKNG